MLLVQLVARAAILTASSAGTASGNGAGLGAAMTASGAMRRVAMVMNENCILVDIELGYFVDLKLVLVLGLVEDDV